MTLRGVPARLAALYLSIASSALVTKRIATIEALAELSNLLNRAVPVNDYEAGLADAVRLMNGANCKRELNPAYLVLLMDGQSIANIFRVDGIVNIQWNSHEKGFTVIDLARGPRADAAGAGTAQAHDERRDERRDEDLYTDMLPIVPHRPYQPGTPYFGATKGRQSGSQPRRSGRPKSDYASNQSNGRVDGHTANYSDNSRANGRDQRDSDRSNRTQNQRRARDDGVGRREGPRRGAAREPRRDERRDNQYNDRRDERRDDVIGIQPRRPPLIAPMSSAQCVEIQNAALAATKEHRRDARMESIVVAVDTKTLPWVGRIEETKAIINEGAQLMWAAQQPVVPDNTTTDNATLIIDATVTPAAVPEKKPTPSAKELALSAEWW